jgi:hypothetical protein
VTFVVVFWQITSYTVFLSRCVTFVVFLQITPYTVFLSKLGEAVSYAPPYIDDRLISHRNALTRHTAHDGKVGGGRGARGGGGGGDGCVVMDDTIMGLVMVKSCWWW